MKRFNNGKLYHGSEVVSSGGLKGATDRTDHFYFFCPKCADAQIVRLLEYTIHQNSPENPYNKDFKRKASEGFTLAFKFHCEKCGHTDFFKISNTGWQGGAHAKVLQA